jgi:hypothetical protein
MVALAVLGNEFAPSPVRVVSGRGATFVSQWMKEVRLKAANHL